MSNKDDLKNRTSKKKAAKALPKQNSGASMKTVKNEPRIKEQKIVDKKSVSVEVKPKVEFNQEVVGVIILCVALMLLVASFGDLKKTSLWTVMFGYEKPEPFKPTNVIVRFGTTVEQDVNYDIYYTVERETWFSENNVTHVSGKQGKHYYYINLPVDKIYSLRLDFGSNPGAVTVHDIYLMGTQNANLSDFAEYQYNQLEDVNIDEDGNLHFVSNGRDPFMIFRHALAQ